MSEEQTRSDPDVVLSTVRRVVSGTSGGPNEAAARDPAQERLLLTPSLRIDDVPDAPPPLASERRARVQTRTLTAERLSLEQRIAELELAVGDGEGWEPDGSEPVDRETPTRFILGADQRQSAIEPSENEAPAAPLDESAQTWAEASTADTPAAPDLTSDPRPAFAPGVAAFRPASAPDPAFHDVSPKAADESPAPEPENEPEADEGFDLYDERVIDEEALRDLVAEIVREELQGELGERITRNVRKLVRREIHRAIMTRDFG